jgi:hypothetical protein
MNNVSARIDKHLSPSARPQSPQPDTALWIDQRLYLSRHSARKSGRLACGGNRNGKIASLYNGGSDKTA